MLRFHLWPFPIVLVVTSLIAALGAAPVSAQAAPRGVLDQFLAAVNRNDAVAAAAMFTDQAIFIGGPCDESPVSACMGKEMIQKALAENPAQVSLQGAPMVEGNGVSFSLEERFELPPAIQSQGVERYVERGSAMIQDDKIAAIALAPDFSDHQTLTAFYGFASMYPPPPSMPTADDGQALFMQPASTQLLFLYEWGDNAAQEWAKQHNAQIHAQ